MTSLPEQIDALLALNAKGAVSHAIPGLAVELLTKAAAALREQPGVRVKPDPTYRSPREDAAYLGSIWSLSANQMAELEKTFEYHRDNNPLTQTVVGVQPKRLQWRRAISAVLYATAMGNYYGVYTNKGVIEATVNLKRLPERFDTEDAAVACLEAIYRKNVYDLIVFPDEKGGGQ